jgi:hypothetical protein
VYGAVRVDLLCNNQAGATTVATAIQNYVDTLPKDQVFRSGIEVVNKHSAWYVTGELIYGDPADAQRLYNQVQVFWNQNPYRNIVQASSRTDWHECHADEGVAYCDIDPANVAIK